MTTEELVAEVNRLRRALRGVAGCTNCRVCGDVAVALVGSPWTPLEEIEGDRE